MPFAGGVALMILTILVFVPRQRLAQVGLRLVEHGGESRVEGSFDPEPLIRDPAGIVTAYDADEFRAKLARETAPT